MSLLQEKKLVGIRPGDKLQSMTHVCWMLHNQCNNQCSYCSPSNYKGDSRWLKYDHVVSFLNRLLEHYKKEVTHISFTGGEPTIWKDFHRICLYLKERGCQIGLTSNGLRPIEYWEEIQNCFNWFCLSYHPEYADNKQLLDLVKLFVNKTNLSVRLMMHKEKKYWDRCIEFAEELKKLENCSYLFVEYVPLQEGFSSPNIRPLKYDPWQEEFFLKESYFNVSDGKTAKEIPPEVDVWDFYSLFLDGSEEFCRPNQIVAEKMDRFKGWTCHAGLDSLFINQDGEIFRGGCRQGGLIGHIFEKKLQLPKKTITCNREYCPCGTDILVRKNAPLSPS